MKTFLLPLSLSLSLPIMAETTESVDGTCALVKDRFISCCLCPFFFSLSSLLFVSVCRALSVCNMVELLSVLVRAKRESLPLRTKPKERERERESRYVLSLCSLSPYHTATPTQSRPLYDAIMTLRPRTFSHRYLFSKTLLCPTFSLTFLPLTLPLSLTHTHTHTRNPLCLTITHTHIHTHTLSRATCLTTSLSPFNNAALSH